MVTKPKPCRNGIKCFKVDCEYNHPDGWNPCTDGAKCENYECTANHPFKRKAKCRDGDRCKSSNCKFLHPNTRAEECPLRAKCKNWRCQKLHPHTRARPCSDKENCTNLSCLCLHPPERAKLLCPSRADCRDLSCKLNHPPERPSRCDQPDSCPNFNCTRLHGSDWNPCEVGDDCEDEHCSKLHSPERNINLQQKTAAAANANNKNKNRKAKKCLKSLEQRMKDWEKAQLPIFSCRSEFCQRLERERMLVVTAETGSGKSTQLPQYAAEYFGSLVVCTQPRVVAALSLARRVAEEYDGTSVGESVGYKVGNANRVVGSSIMFMTDAALIRDSQRDPSLKHIRVLIIDEAHERSLNTDIVLGIAKLLLAQRPNDFYVVIASATIDPARFLDYFDRQKSKPLEVKGRLFPVKEINKPPPSGCSDQKLIETHIIPSVVENYPLHEGHILVFLPGQGEIERALKMFKSKLPDDCIALPLYGSQSPEEQEKVIKFNEKGKRMVVFCTNVAETSLTIPDVRLVLDSGWAKEARYDVKRRLTVIETVRISRSSADQRKGRAGRTASGYCVRLYADAELKRPNIEPEILRSSLDLVLLQLIRLNLDPKTFPFMDQPNSDVINNSIDLLTRLKCIDAQKITKRGELFTELGLDPRLSAFIIEVYIEYPSLLELATAIVAILSAPGTVFFMGGATQEAKQEAKNRVAVQAQNYKSDLLHLYSVYDAWKNAGTKETQGKCLRCTKQVKWCICRIKYSNENGLNNKILQNVDASCASIIKQIKNAHWLKPGSKMPENLIDIIGIRLAEIFSEQCGYLLVPELPVEGVRLVSTDIRANITNTSVFMQKLHTDTNRALYQHFIAMTITQLSSGNYIIERLHPILKTQATVQSPMQRLMTIENIGSEVFHLMRQKLNTYQSESWAKWAVYQYDRPHCQLIVWGLEADKSTIVSIVQRTQNETLKKLSDSHELLECGPIKANFQSGLICTHINKMTNTLRLDLQNVPNLTFNDLKDWLKKIIDIEWNEIKDHGFHTVKVETGKSNNNDQSKSLYLIFKNEDAFRRATNKVPPYYLSEQGNGFGIRRDNEKETWGRELLIQTPANVTVQDIINRYGTDVIVKCLQLNKQNEKQRVESSLKLNNLPLTSDEKYLRECLQTAGGPTPKHVHVGRTNKDICGWAKITFNDEEQRNNAAAIYGLRLCQNTFPITIPGKNGPKQKFVQTKVEKDDNIDSAQTQSHSLSKNLFRITIISREATLNIFSSKTSTTTSSAGATSMSNLTDTSEWTIDSSATVTVLRTDLYPDFQQIVDRICEKFGVKVQSKNISNNGKRYTFTDGSPQKTSLAASMVAQNFAPMNIKLNTDRQKQLFNELEEVGEIQKWAIELCLAINKNKWNTNIEIRGQQIAQGQLMRRIADYSDDFDKRFREHELSATVAAFFGRQKAATIKLQQIASRWSSKSCLVSFIPKTSTIIINRKPKGSVKDMNDCENEVIQLLNEITATAIDEESDEEEEKEYNDDDEDVEESDTTSVKAVRQDRRCVFCKQKSSISTSLFRICGHAYCRCAAQALSSSISFPLQCKDCQSNIHIRDIQIIFSNDEQLFMHLLKNSIQNYLTINAQQDDRIFCPNDECDGLIKLSQGYQTCLTCGQCVCPKCQAIDDELHVGRTCAQLIEEKKRREFLPQLFIAAKKFVEDYWPIDTQMQPIGRIDENPYLKKQYKSLKRFYKGIATLGHPFPPDLAKGFFAYHGCPFQAITSICQNGFDPKRRSGQAYGRGEYFGITASVSHGYAQKGGSQAGFSQMIIAFLLRCPQTTTHGNYCYVVDNPIDWTYAFNLPVLMVTYGQTSTSQLSPFPNTITDYVDDESPWKAPFRWYWRQDNGQFEPYNDTINEILEKSYEQWKLHGGPSTVVTPPLTRYIDDTPQTYQIDYQNNRQTNMKTSYQRVIDRRPIDKPPDNQNWFYRDEHGNWMRYECLIQNSIEKAFQLYRSGQGSSIIDIHFPGRPETYQINFLKGQQTNKTTNAVKDIKRE
jgi:HrpA-like RNA helicase